MKKAKKNNKHLPLLIAGIFILAACLAGAAWAGRSYIRGTAVSSYVNTVYRPFFEHTFNSNFTPVNNILKEVGAYSGIDPHTNSGNACNVVSYSGIQETAFCQRMQETKGIIPTPAFVSDWKFGSPNLETYLLAHGWQKRDKQSLTALFDNPREARWVNYSKGNDRGNCHLYIHYEGRPKPTTALSGDNKFYVDESCERWIYFFQ